MAEWGEEIQENIGWIYPQDERLHEKTILCKLVDIELVTSQNGQQYPKISVETSEGTLFFSGFRATANDMIRKYGPASSGKWKGQQVVLSSNGRKITISPVESDMQ